MDQLPDQISDIRQELYDLVLGIHGLERYLDIMAVDIRF